MGNSAEQAGWFSVAIVTLSLLAGCGADHSKSQRTEAKLARASPVNYAVECVPADDRELKLFDMAASAIELTEKDELSSLDLGADRFLSHARRGSPAKSVAVCIPDDILIRVANAWAARDRFRRGGISEYTLQLAGMFPRVDPWLIDSIGKAAFGQSMIPSEFINGEDIRPRVRSALAGYGALANKFSQVAYEQMSSENALGTGAAQVATATGHPDALSRVVIMMEELLARTSEDVAVPFRTQERLYELALAIYFAGPAAKEHTAPLHKTIRRKVESWAPPFGMIEVPPTEYCGLLIAIEGEASINPYPFCADQKPTNVLLPRT